LFGSSSFFDLIVIGRGCSSHGGKSTTAYVSTAYKYQKKIGIAPRSLSQRDLPGRADDVDTAQRADCNRVTRRLPPFQPGQARNFANAVLSRIRLWSRTLKPRGGLAAGSVRGSGRSREIARSSPDWLRTFAIACRCGCFPLLSRCGAIGITRVRRLGQVGAADSTGRCNTFAEHLSGCMEAECLARPLIQLSRDRVELRL